MRTCWQIRQSYSRSLLTAEDRTAEGSGPTGETNQPEWRIECDQCPIGASSIPCWEQCGGADCCCAPIHLTCDFCAIYIEHRREIARLIQGKPATTRADAGQSVRELEPDSLGTYTNPTGGGSTIMEKLQLSVPDMYADHHVLRARAALSALPGVQDVLASSAFRIITLSYDPNTITPGAIMAEIEDAGYRVATNGTGVVAPSVPFADGRRDPAWTRLGTRQTKTDERDIKTQR